VASELTFLRRKMDERRDALAHSLAQNPRRDPFEYGKAVGEYEAYDTVVSLIIELTKGGEDDQP